jgi:hypothetical protein
MGVETAFAWGGTASYDAESRRFASGRVVVSFD